MSKDEAFRRWLPSRPLAAQTSDYPRDHIERVAKDAWHAAVKHTLAYVAGELHKQAGIVGSPSAWCMQDLVNLVMRMKP